MSFAMYLRELRHARQMPQSLLAVALGITPKSLVELESGRRVPSIQELQQLADALNVAERELMVRAGYLASVRPR
jgi:transcriptional regulator with XRE-family HTH domain